MSRTIFYQEVESVLHQNILSFWLSKMVDSVRGGFYGQITGKGYIMPDAPKGGVLHARILWAFSAAFRKTGRKEYLATAYRAKKYLIDHFYDEKYGGIYWSLQADGTPLETKKQIYALGFAIYGLSEYNRATGDQEALDYAIRLYYSIEKNSFDPQYNGYLEAFTREWTEIGDMRLSEKDINEKKTTNTHLHILEPYTNLYRVWPSAELKQSLENLIHIFSERILIRKTRHLGLFFDEQWRKRDSLVSYGHDIEASWLLVEAANVLNDDKLLQKTKKDGWQLTMAATEGLQPDGSMVYERHADGTVDTERHWWVQAETVVGFMWLWRYYGYEPAYEMAFTCWRYIKENLIDNDRGEWWWGIFADGRKDESNDKAGFWKCPYHNTRMCLEVMALLRE